MQNVIVEHTHHSSDPAVAELRGGFTSTRFVLVEPSHPGNVGAAARALKTMGFRVSCWCRRACRTYKAIRKQSRWRAVCTGRLC
ncbi:MAG: tRNA (cytidine(32)/uridine(32)-2'-O)-methyltransferase (EC [uncultured Paraburkholderia sp.]|nr:MAG: tRNA (cytidine(32)/uridine(32)-2'-O)-methyltransferase (EC [uncultured Paraburkholderia sp.]CAH2912852.1 MAG: tRNA (cytidine(32)/uridine(32)-2'-O)-methyltransferase (EC [uncultured Paraburkholderia sp.]